MSRSKLDQTQIIQSVFDADSGSLKTSLLPTEISFEGTSQVHVQADGVVNCAGFEYVCLYGTGTVSVSPNDDGTDMVALTVTEAEPKLICARTIQIVGTGKIVIQSV